MLPIKIYKEQVFSSKKGCNVIDLTGPFITKINILNFPIKISIFTMIDFSDLQIIGYEKNNKRIVTDRKLKGNIITDRFDSAKIKRDTKNSFILNFTGNNAIKIPSKNSGKCPIKFANKGKFIFSVKGNSKYIRA